jgi:hypothetical protein
MPREKTILSTEIDEHMQSKRVDRGELCRYGATDFI